VPVKKELHKAVLGTGLAIVGAGFATVYWIGPSSGISVFVTFGLLLALLFLVKQGAKWQLFRQSRTLGLPFPLVSSRWDVRGIVKGLVYILGSLAWVACVGFGIKFNILGVGAFPVLAALLLLLPFCALLVVGLFLLIRSVISRN
jgi:hypothetical protein